MRQYKLIPRKKAIVRQILEMQFTKPEFKKEIEHFREKWKINYTKPEGLDRVNSLLDDLEKDSSIGLSFHHDLYDIIRKFNLTNSWYIAIFNYIGTNKCDPSHDPEAIIAYKDLFEDLPKKQLPQYGLELNSNVRKQDLMNAWKEIETFVKNDVEIKGQRVAENFDRDQLIYQLRENKKLGYKEIQAVILNNYEDTPDEGHLRSIVSKYKKRIK